jgi:hypothetical protein
MEERERHPRPAYGPIRLRRSVGAMEANTPDRRLGTRIRRLGRWLDSRSRSLSSRKADMQQILE